MMSPQQKIKINKLRLVEWMLIWTSLTSQGFRVYLISNLKLIIAFLVTLLLWFLKVKMKMS